MNIYYKRIKTWGKYPFQDEVDTDLVHFSKSKNKFSSFLTIDPHIDMNNRKDIVAEKLNIKNIKLIKA